MHYARVLTYFGSKKNVVRLVTFLKEDGRAIQYSIQTQDSGTGYAVRTLAELSDPNSTGVPGVCPLERQNRRRIDFRSNQIALARVENDWMFHFQTSRPFHQM